MTKITINNRTYAVRTNTVGQNFGTVARVRIGGRSYESRTCPFGFAAAAVADVSDKVRADYPKAHIS